MRVHSIEVMIYSKKKKKLLALWQNSKNCSFVVKHLLARLRGKTDSVCRDGKRHDALLCPLSEAALYSLVRVAYLKYKDQEAPSNLKWTL